MCKRELVSMARRGRKYRVCLDDIKGVHRAVCKKRPALPKFESPTEDELDALRVSMDATA